MKACFYAAHGGTDQLIIGELPEPDPAPGEVKVRVWAVALNGFDPMMLEGSTGLKVPMPMVPCGDFAGEVVALGDGVTSWTVGQRVTAHPVLPNAGMMGEVTPGAAAQFIVVPQEVLIALPDAVSYEDAAALPVAYGTALRMMQTRGEVGSGERVLILGATGGVGVAAIQLAKMVGAEVTACGRGADRVQRLSDIGADHVIDTGKEEWFQAARQIAGKPSYEGSGDGGYDVLVNYIGGETWAAGLKQVRRHGRILVCGATAGYAPPTDLRYVWSFELSVIGSNGWTMDDQAHLLKMVADGDLKPVINDVRPLEDMPEAFDDLIARRVFGKQVLTI